MRHAPRYHISIIRSNLTRSIARITSDIHDEVVTAFEEYFPTNIDGGTLLHTFAVEHDEEAEIEIWRMGAFPGHRNTVEGRLQSK